MAKYYYRYLHENGKWIDKAAYAVESYGGPEEYFDSPFVQTWEKVPMGQKELVFITFGQIHTHTVDGKEFHKDVVAVIEANSEMDGRRIAFNLFGDKFATSYTMSHPPDMSLFPGGFVAVNF